ncbi:MAG: glycosyltransferase [Magnetococcales bacterium]|nr:glycosyltransferase [Magnetococcales bacterium]MBF0156727.1 glycosyltransferase [Magnetococcales bacterium]
MPAPVAYIVSRFPKITETFVLHEILAIERLGIPVLLFPLLREREKVAHPEAARLAGTAHYLPLISWSILAAHGHYLRRRPGAYLRMFAEVFAGSWRSRRLLKGALGTFPKAALFARRMEQLGVRHIHAHFATHPALAALIVHRLTGIPFSFTGHGSDIHKETRMLDVKLRAAAFAVTISDYNVRYFEEAFGPWVRAKSRVVRCGVDPDRFLPPPARSRQPGAPLEILCVASFRLVKGHAFLLEGCRLLKERGWRFRLHLVGDGPEASSIRRQLEAAGLTGEVILHGPLPGPEVALRMQSADVVALTSVMGPEGEREGIPVALMEAMACERPVVSSRLSGIPELVIEGETGFLTEPGDSEAIATALARLAADPELCQKLGEAGRRRVLAEYHLAKNAAVLAGMFQNGETG